MMILNLELPNNLRTKRLLRQEDIPCVCRIGSKFELILGNTLGNYIGLVCEWDRQKFELVAPALAGGDVTYFNDCLITLKDISENEYKVIKLSLFFDSIGWVDVIESGDYLS